MAPLKHRLQKVRFEHFFILSIYSDAKKLSEVTSGDNDEQK